MRAAGYIIFLLAGLYQLVLGFAFFNAEWGLLGVLAFVFFPPLPVIAPFVMWGVVGVFPSVYFVAWVVGWLGLLLASGLTVPGWAAWSLRFVALAVFFVAFWPAAIAWGALMVRQYIKDRPAAAPSVAAPPPPLMAREVVPEWQASAYPAPTTEVGRREREKNEQVMRTVYERIEAAKRTGADAAAPFCGSCGKARDSLSPKFCRWCGAA